MANKLRVFTAFSGYDSQMLGLRRVQERHPDLEVELVGWSEIDPAAIKAHDALFPEYAERNYGDISRIDWSVVPDFDLFTYSSPCQDFSAAGLQRGGTEGSGTRSSLLWECRRAIIAKRPKYLVLENVAALVSAKFKPLFNKWEQELAGYGYTNYCKVINAADYIPQNRERIFLVSVLDDCTPFRFVEPSRPMTERMRDYLEREQDIAAKYYLAQSAIDRLIKHCQRQDANGNGFKPVFKSKDEITGTINTRFGEHSTDTFVREPIAEPDKVVQYPRGKNGGGLLEVTACPTISCSNFQNNLFAAIPEPAVLRKARTDEERERRHREGDAGTKFSAYDFHRADDGRTNTITGVAKDNLVTVADEPRTIVAANLDYPEDTQRKSYRGAGQDQARRIYDPAGISPAICAVEDESHENRGGRIAAMRGRKDKNGILTQRLEINANDRVINTLTSVQKDNLVIFPIEDENDAVH